MDLNISAVVSILAIVIAVGIFVSLMFGKPIVNALQYRWETGRWPRSGSPDIDDLNRWEDGQDVADLDAQIAGVGEERAKAVLDYQEQRKAAGTLSVTRDTIMQLGERQKKLVLKRKHKSWLAGIVGSSIASNSEMPEPLDDSQPVNGKVKDPEGVLVASKS